MFNDGGNRGTSLLQRVKRRVSEELSVPPSTAKERFRHELKYLISGMRTESWTLGRPDWSPHVFDGGSAQGR